MPYDPSLGIMVSTELLAVSGVVIAIHALLTMALNIHWGETGLVNFGHVAFFAVGAYAAAILTTPTGSGITATREIGFGLPLVFGAVGGIVAAVLLALVIGVIAIDMEDDQFAMTTIVIAEVIRLTLRNLDAVSGGAAGISGISRPLSSSISFNYSYFYFGLMVAVLIGAYLLIEHIIQSPFGRVLHAIREDEQVPRALGKDTYWFKMKGFAMGAAFAGLAGALWAQYARFIGPEQMIPLLTFTIWAALILGGQGSSFGAIAGAVLVYGTRQLTRHLPSNIPFQEEIPYIRLIIFGALMIAVMYYRPYGMFGDKTRMQAGFDSVEE